MYIECVYHRDNRLMRCGRISVAGDAEEIAVSPKPKYRQRHGKRLNPYSTTGLDKFESIYAELSAKREYIAQKTGAPEAMVRFVSSKKGWIPVVLGARDQEMRKKTSGGDADGVSIVVPAENNNGKTGVELSKDEGNDITVERENISISVLDERRHSLVMQWSRFLQNTTLGFLGVSAMLVKFIVCGASCLAVLFGNPNPSQEAIAEQQDGNRRIPRAPGLTVSAPASPLGAHGDPTDFLATASPRAAKPQNIDSEHKHHQSKVEKYRRAVSMDNRPTRLARSDSFFRPAMAYDANLGATVMILTLLCFVFYGRFCAIFFTCACLYLFTMFREGSERKNRNNDCRMVDLQSSEYRKKLIRNGFMERKHN